MSSNNVLEIESSDVIKLILQFLKENSLNSSFDALQKESQISLNTVLNPELLASDIKNGLWDNVLNSISNLKLPIHKLINLYEQIILELIELREMDVSRTLLKQTQAMAVLKQTQPERYQKLENFLARTYIEPKELYPQANKSKRRQDISNEIMREITVVEPSRLLSLLTQSLKFQQEHGNLSGTGSDVTSVGGTRHYDLFRGRVPTQEEEEEMFPRICTKTIKFSGKSCPEVARFSPDGSMLITGAIDGFIEVYNPYDGQLRTDLQYQANERFMMHKNAVLCLNFSRNGEYLISGSQDGTIKIWRLSTGECVKDLPNVHQQGITSVTLSKDDGQILSTSFDGSVMIHGVKSGKTLKVLKGHTSYVNTAHWSRDMKTIVSGSTDGYIRIWDSNGNCTHMFTPGNIQLEIDIHTIIPLPHYGEHQFIVSNKSKAIYLMNLAGETISTFSSLQLSSKHSSSSSTTTLETNQQMGKDQSGSSRDFISCTISPKGNWLYGVTEDSTLLCFNILTGELVHDMKIHEKEVIGLHHHPFKNSLLSYSTDGSLKMWKS